MHPNMNPATRNALNSQKSDPMSFAQLALLVALWAALFAIGAIVMA